MLNRNLAEKEAVIEEMQKIFDNNKLTSESEVRALKLKLAKGDINEEQLKTATEKLLEMESIHQKQVQEIKQLKIEKTYLMDQ